MLVDEIGRRLARAEDEFQEPAALALRADFAAANEIAFRNDADELAVGVDDRKPADVLRQHGVGRIGDLGVRGDRYDRPGHDLVGAHGRLRKFEMKSDRR